MGKTERLTDGSYRALAAEAVEQGRRNCLGGEMPWFDIYEMEVTGAGGRKLLLSLGGEMEADETTGYVDESDSMGVTTRSLSGFGCTGDIAAYDAETGDEVEIDFDEGKFQRLVDAMC